MRHRRRLRSISTSSNDAGFSLLEALVATTIVAVGAGSLLQLFILSTSVNRATSAATFASTFARQKMEELRASTCTTSPPDALARDAPGYCDSLDADGNVVGGDSPVCGAAGGSGAYVRRWSIATGRSSGTLVLQVLVTVKGSLEQARLVSARALIPE